MYSRRTLTGFGNPGKASQAASRPRLKPLKRPMQTRAKFTVQAIYDAFVRIWRTKGWDGITTRAVALETGVSVGTLYEYFPNRYALLSGYIRHCVDTLLAAIDLQVIQPGDLAWQERLRRLVRLTCGIDTPELPYFDDGMLSVEYQIAEAKHHRRVYEELSAKWMVAIDACADLSCKPSAQTVTSLYLSVWGGRRYLLLVSPQDISAQQWVEEMQRLCSSVLAASDAK